MDEEVEILQEAMFAYERGCHLYDERELVAARVCYEKALSLAVRTGHRDFEDACRYGLATTNMQLGRLRSALETLAPLVREPGAPESDLRFSAHVELAAVAQQIPIPVPRIETIYSELWELVGDDAVRETEVLVFLSRHLLYRGMLEDARTAAETAITRKLGVEDVAESWGQVFDYHYYGLCGIELAAGDLGRARRLVDEWADAPDQMPPNRILRMARAEAEIALAAGELDAAADAANTADEAALQTDYEEVTGPVHWTRLRVAWERNDSDAALAALRSLGPYRGSQRRMLRQTVLQAFATESARRGRCTGIRLDQRRRREATELAGLLQNPAWSGREGVPLLWI